MQVYQIAFKCFFSLSQRTADTSVGQHQWVGICSEENMSALSNEAVLCFNGSVPASRIAFLLYYVDCPVNP